MTVSDRYVILLSLTAVLMLACACSQDRLSRDDEGSISFAVDMLQTRTTLFEDYAGLLDESKGGRSFSVYSYVSQGSANAGKTYIDNATVDYFYGTDGTTVAEYWTFAESHGGAHIKYYWPLSDNLDFFAYMPRVKASAGVTAIGYDQSTGCPTFTCGPLGQNTASEFICAYKTDQNKGTQDAAGGKVKLNFRHPYAAIYFKLGNSYRMTLNSMTIAGIAVSGTCTYEDNRTDAAFLWTPSTAKPGLDLTVGKDVPGELNLGALVNDSPYLVIPQSLDNVKLRLDVTRPGYEDFKYDDIPLSTTQVTKWEPGKRYTYTLDLGETKEEILFTVLVDEWDVVDYKNEIEVK